MKAPYKVIRVPTAESWSSVGRADSAMPPQGQGSSPAHLTELVGQPPDSLVITPCALGTASGARSAPMVPPPKSKRLVFLAAAILVGSLLVLAAQNVFAANSLANTVSLPVTPPATLDLNKPGSTTMTPSTALSQAAVPPVSPSIKPAATPVSSPAVTGHTGGDPSNQGGGTSTPTLASAPSGTTTNQMALATTLSGASAQKTSTSAQVSELPEDAITLVAAGVLASGVLSAAAAFAGNSVANRRRSHPRKTAADAGKNDPVGEASANKPATPEATAPTPASSPASRLPMENAAATAATAPTAATAVDPVQPIVVTPQDSIVAPDSFTSTPHVLHGSGGAADLAYIAQADWAAALQRKYGVNTQAGPHHACVSITGSRDENQDYACQFQVVHSSGRQDDCILVADGCGGHPGGREASCLAVRAASEFLCENRQLAPAERVRGAISAASQALIQAGTHWDSNALRTTLIVVIADDKQYSLAWIGDGGIDLRRASGQWMSLLVAHKSGAQNLLSASLGPDQVGQPSFATAQRLAGDQLFVGSDGVFEVYDDPAAFWGAWFESAVVQRAPQTCLNELLDKCAQHQRFDDNLSVAYLRTPVTAAKRLY